MKNYFKGSGDVSPDEQADVAYREMRRSLVKFAAIEAEMHERAQTGQLSPQQESILIGQLNGQRDRILVFAAVYHVEVDRARSRLINY